MALVVQKFGGTSVGTPERMAAVADRIYREYVAGTQLVVVVSAMGKTTDDLIELAHRISPAPPHREMDMLLTAGERISMALLSMALADRGVPALSFTGSQTGIVTDQSHQRARIKRILGDRVRSAIQARKVAIVAGFQGVSEDREITTLGRGGSDTTAVALAAALHADRCDIFTDVPGVFSADPRMVPSAKVWKTIPHDLMVELATRGAGVLHPRSVELAKQYGVQLCVRSSFEEAGGTEVQKRSEGMESFGVAGVTADDEKMLLTVTLARPTTLGALLDRSARAHLSLVAGFFSGMQYHAFIERDAEKDWKTQLEDLIQQGFISSFQFHYELVPVSVVGDRFSQDGEALLKILDTLSKQEIFATIGSCSALAMTVAVPKNRWEEAVALLHQAEFQTQGA